MILDKPVYLSRPGISLSDRVVDNDDVLRKIERNYRGAPREFAKIKRIINQMFSLTGTDKRYFPDEGKRAVDYCVNSIHKCMDHAQKSTDLIDVLIFGGIGREYLEPATAMEVANKLGLENVYGFDVTSACVGFVEATHMATLILQTHSDKHLAVACTSEYNEAAMDFDIQSREDLNFKGAGLTLSGGAAAWVLSKTPFSGEHARIVGFHNEAFPEHCDACHLKLGGKFLSDGNKIFNAGLKHMPSAITKMLEEVNWTTEELSFIAFHQPSNDLLTKIADEINVPHDKITRLHHLYGNSATATTPISLNYLVENNLLKRGDKVLVATGAAGFAISIMALEWY